LNYCDPVFINDVSPGKSSKPNVTSNTGTAYPSAAHDITPDVKWS